MTMLFLRYLLLLAGFGLFAGAAAILVYDLYVIFKGRKQPLPELNRPPGESLLEEPEGPRFSPMLPHKPAAQRMALAGVAPALMGLSIAIVPSGQAGVRVSQLWGATQRTLFPGVHWTVPLVDHVELYNIRDAVYSTTLAEDSSKDPNALRVQTKEGLPVGLAITVRYRLDA